MSPPTLTVNFVADDAGRVVPPSPEQPTSVLWGLIEEEKWDEASRRCIDHREEARRKKDEKLPIHNALLSRPPLSLLKCLHEAYGEGVKTADSFGFLPLHVACANSAPLEVIRYLLDVYPEGASAKDKYGQKPIHYFGDWLSDEDNAAVKKMLSALPEAKEKATQLAEEAAQADEAARAARAAAEDAETAADEFREASDEAAWMHALAREEAHGARKAAEAADRLSKRTRDEADKAEENVRNTMRRVLPNTER